MIPLSLISELNNISKFVESGGLAKALENIADNELNAAIKTLNNLSGFKVKREGVNLALSHLQSVHEHYYSIQRNSVSPNMVNQSESVAIKDFWVCCLISICHKYLDNGIELIKTYLIYANLAAEEVHGAGSYGEQYNDIYDRLNPGYGYFGFIFTYSELEDVLGSYDVRNAGEGMRLAKKFVPGLMSLLNPLTYKTMLLPGRKEIMNLRTFYEFCNQLCPGIIDCNNIDLDSLGY